MISDKIRFALNFVCISFLMIDSGGGLGLRNISFLIIILFAVYQLFIIKKVNKYFLILYITLLLSLIPGIFVSLSNPAIQINVILVWTSVFFLIPLFFLYVQGSKLNNIVFVKSGAFFGLLIIFLFFGRLFGNPAANAINDYIVLHSNGFFGDKSFISGNILPNVYFQGTLSLIICAVISLQGKHYYSYGIILIALILAPSRFGFIVLILWGLIVFVRKSFLRVLVVPLFAVIIFLVLYNLPFGTEVLGIFNGQSDGVEIRNGHIQSVINEFKGRPLAFFTGEGPGSEFYTKGYGRYADNIELSQFEYLRKYGIVSFIAATFFYFWPLLGKKKDTFFLKGALIMYYFVSFSNPVLYSIFAMLFLTYAYIENFSNTSLVTYENQ